jgi:RHS repeat-associated protein
LCRISPQTRTFAYFGLTNRLTQATNPENGSVGYEYDSAQRLWRKTDAKGQKVEYAYDSYNRVTQIKRYPNGSVEDVCRRTSFYYDVNPFDAYFSANTWGRPVAAEWGGVACSGGILFREMYSYTAAGLRTKKRLRAAKDIGAPYGVQSADLDGVWTYDNEGRVVTVKYPDTYYEEPSGNYPPVLMPGALLTYTYNRLGQPVQLATSTGGYLVSNAQYGPAGEMTDFGAEHRTYNNRLQVTRIQGTGYDYQYDYNAPGGNNGQVWKETRGAEQITYQYDELKRLVSATGQPAYTYDGFGNLTGMGAPVDAATNRIATYSYDANGNVTGMPQMTLEYDVENRITRATHQTNGIDEYGYDPANQRVLKNGEVTYYGVDGKRMGRYLLGRLGSVPNVMLAFQSPSINNPAQFTYFAGRPTWAVDRVGSAAGGTGYTAYGVERVLSANDADKFATYYRDAKTGLDYAVNRYYWSGLGRFLTADPYVATAESASNPADPQSWNRYAYVQGDPISYNDPDGLKPAILDRAWQWLKGLVDPEASPRPGAIPYPISTYEEYVYDEEVNNWKSPLTVRLREMVRTGEATDCQALAMFASEMAERATDTELGYGGSSGATVGTFINSFGVLTPTEVPL